MLDSISKNASIRCQFHFSFCFVALLGSGVWAAPHGDVGGSLGLRDAVKGNIAIRATNANNSAGAVVLQKGNVSDIH